MARNITIDHRNVSREKAAPKVIKASTGTYAPATQETLYETEEIKQLHAQIVSAEAIAAGAEAKLKTKNAELTALHSLLKAARDGSQNLRQQLAEIDTSGKVPSQVEVVDVAWTALSDLPKSFFRSCS
jgi:chromosome segregation ATPase